MDDILNEAAAEVDASERDKSSFRVRHAVDQSYDDDFDEEFSSAAAAPLTTKDVKSILKKSAQIVSLEDAADGRQNLKQAVSSLTESIPMKEKERIQESRESPTSAIHEISDDEIASRLHAASLHVGNDGSHHLQQSENEIVEESDHEEEGEEEGEEEEHYDENQNFLFSCYHGNLSEVERHLERGANRLYRDRHGWTSLHWAAAKGYDELMEILLKNYPRNIQKYINCKDNLAGMTPLHLACIGGHLDCIRILLDFNVKKKLRNNLGEFPGDCIGPSLRTPDGRRIAKLLGIWKEREGDGDKEGKDGRK